MNNPVTPAQIAEATSVFDEMYRKMVYLALKRLPSHVVIGVLLTFLDELVAIPPESGVIEPPQIQALRKAIDGCFTQLQPTNSDHLV